MERKLTTAQERRAKHRTPDDEGRCLRCGLGADPEHNHGNCPPGFWMNKHEQAAWARGVRYDA